jgi:adenosylmethionine-8-amino-7-oxononanoate aminotransferase
VTHKLEIMTSRLEVPPGTALDDTQRAIHDNLWLQWTAMGAGREIPVITAADGCYITDQHGRRYLDGLAGLFAVQVGYGFRDEIADVAAGAMRVLPYAHGFGFTNPAAVALASKIASLAPGDLNHVHFVSGGSEAVDTAWKMARQYFALRGERRFKVIARDLAYHGCTFGALSLSGYDGIAAPFEPLVPGVVHFRNTKRFRRPEGETDEEFTAFLLDDLERAVRRAGPSSVAMIIVEPVQNWGGVLPSPPGYLEGVRAICAQHGILMCLDEVITGYGRLGEWFGSIRYGVVPDLMTNAKGLSSAYAVIGAVVASDRVMEPFLADPSAMFLHGMTFAGHPVQAAVALKNLEILERENILAHVRQNESRLRESLESLLELPIVGDVRGAGFKWGVELVRNPETNEPFTPDEVARVLYGFIAPELFSRGVIGRASSHDGAVMQFCPPLVAGEQEFATITQTLGGVLEEAWDKLGK